MTTKFWAVRLLKRGWVTAGWTLTSDMEKAMFFGDKDRAYGFADMKAVFGKTEVVEFDVTEVPHE